MTYIISDIHGCYDLYRAMLEKIAFSSRDTLYILGDVIDRGDSGIKILLDLMDRKNTTLLMGNHEYLMAVLLSNCKEPIDRTTVLDDNMTQALQLWFADGGKQTFMEYLMLSADDKNRIARFLVKLPLFVEVSASGVDFVLVHAGLDHFSVSRELKDYQADELLFHHSALGKPYFANKTVVVGHTPTFAYGKEYTGKILSVNRVINVDCGCAYPESGVLGCLRVEDFKEFYVA